MPKPAIAVCRSASSRVFDCMKGAKRKGQSMAPKKQAAWSGVELGRMVCTGEKIAAMTLSVGRTMRGRMRKAKISCMGKVSQCRGFAMSIWRGAMKGRRAAKAKRAPTSLRAFQGKLGHAGPKTRASWVWKSWIAARRKRGTAKLAKRRRKPSRNCVPKSLSSALLQADLMSCRRLALSLLIAVVPSGSFSRAASSSGLKGICWFGEGARRVTL